MMLYRSLDDGQFYREEDVDPADRVNPERYQRVRVRNTFTVRAEDLPGNNDIFELLQRCVSAPCIEVDS